MNQEIGLLAARDFLTELVQFRHVAEILNALEAFLADRPHSMGVGVWLLRPDESPPVLQLLRMCRSTLRPPATWREAWGTFERVPLDEPILGQVARSATSQLTSTSAGWVPPPWAAEQGVAAYCSNAIVHRGERLGVICNFLRWAVLPHQVDESLFVMNVLALHIGATLANERAMDEVERARRALELENRSLREEVRDVRGLKELLGQSPPMRSCLEQVRLVADTDAPVLLLGETGTGKELVAHAIHDQSRRAQHALVKVNCPSVPTSLFESEFFGHVRGAFTGALQERVGRFQLADKGTLFLDEISEVPLELQSKLLRVLQTGTYERVGEDRSRQVDVRVIAASNRDLAQEAAAGRFRPDLFYRLNVFPVSLPPLRERAGDVELLAVHFFTEACHAVGVRDVTLTPQHLERLRRYPWPGNVRELRNAMERLAILSRRGPPSVEALQFLLPSASPGPAPTPQRSTWELGVAAPSPAAGSSARFEPLSDEARSLERQHLERLRRSAWSGSVQDLRLAMERLAILSGREPPSVDGLEALLPPAPPDSAPAPTPKPGASNRLTDRSETAFGETETGARGGSTGGVLVARQDCGPTRPPVAGSHRPSQQVREADRRSRAPRRSQPLSEEERGLERQRIERALADAQGRIEGVGGAADRLGMSPTALRRRLKAFGLR